MDHCFSPWFVFWVYNIIITFLSSLFYLHTLPKKPPPPPSNPVLFIHYLSLLAYIWICKYTPKYYLLCLYNDICVYIFRVNNLELDNQLLFSSLGKTTSISPRFSQLSIVLCIGLKPHLFFPHSNPLGHDHGCCIYIYAQGVFNGNEIINTLCHHQFLWSNFSYNFNIYENAWAMTAVSELPLKTNNGLHDGVWDTCSFQRYFTARSCIWERI